MCVLDGEFRKANGLDLLELLSALPLIKCNVRDILWAEQSESHPECLFAKQAHGPSRVSHDIRTLHRPSAKTDCDDVRSDKLHCSSSTVFDRIAYSLLGFHVSLHGFRKQRLGAKPKSSVQPAKGQATIPRRDWRNIFLIVPMPNPRWASGCGRRCGVVSVPRESKPRSQHTDRTGRKSVPLVPYRGFALRYGSTAEGRLDGMSQLLSPGEKPADSGVWRRRSTKQQSSA